VITIEPAITHYKSFVDHGKTAWTFVNGSNGETGDITFYFTHDRDLDDVNKWTETFNNGTIVKGYWVPYMVNEIVMCHNYKAANLHSNGAPGCIVYDYTKTYDINHLVHSINLKGPSKLDDMMRTVYPSNAYEGKLVIKGNETDNLTDPPAIAQIAPQSDHSKAWNAGYAQGYLGVSLKGSHTPQFFWGYYNATQDLQQNIGYACGMSGKITATDKMCNGEWRLNYGNANDRNSFHYGNNTGWSNRIYLVNGDSSQKDRLSSVVLPKNTTDGYRDYFVGMANGLHGDAPRSVSYNILDIPCNGTAEYCAGNKAGIMASNDFNA
jgi:hypothetical protein